MIIRALDSGHDFTFGKGKSDYLQGNLAVAENIQTRLLCFLGDCFFDINSGIDWKRLLGSVGITNQEVELSCRAVILLSYGVIGINQISVARRVRALYLNYNINSIFTSNFVQQLEVSANG